MSFTGEYINAQDLISDIIIMRHYQYLIFGNGGNYLSSARRNLAGTAQSYHFNDR